MLKRAHFHSLTCSIIASGNSEKTKIPSNSVDYLFIDPPFGANLMYSELNFLWESWLKVFTNNQPEAIENKVQGKTLNDYRRLMTDCFKEAFRILKPGRWMTIEFSNTQDAVWNAIQTAIQEAGFIVANVAALDKQARQLQSGYDHHRRQTRPHHFRLQTQWRPRRTLYPNRRH